MATSATTKKARVARESTDTDSAASGRHAEKTSLSRAERHRVVRDNLAASRALGEVTRAELERIDAIRF